MTELSTFISESVVVWDPSHIKSVSLLPIADDGLVRLTDIMEERHKIPYAGDGHWQFIPFCNEGVWSLFVVTDIVNNMTPRSTAQ